MQKALSPWKSYGNRDILFATIEWLPQNAMWLYVHVQSVIEHDHIEIKGRPSAPACSKAILNHLKIWS